jgi:hypothetical protein
MAIRKDVRSNASPGEEDVVSLQVGIRALGDYSHVSVKSGRGHLQISRATTNLSRV